MISFTKGKIFASERDVGEWILKTTDEKGAFIALLLAVIMVGIFPFRIKENLKRMRTKINRGCYYFVTNLVIKSTTLWLILVLQCQLY